MGPARDGQAGERPAAAGRAARTSTMGLLRGGSFASQQDFFTWRTVPLPSTLYKKYKGERWRFLAS